LGNCLCQIVLLWTCSCCGCCRDHCVWPVGVDHVVRMEKPSRLAGWQVRWKSEPPCPSCHDSWRRSTVRGADGNVGLANPFHSYVRTKRPAGVFDAKTPLLRVRTLCRCHVDADALPRSCVGNPDRPDLPRRACRCFHAVRVTRFSLRASARH